MLELLYGQWKVNVEDQLVFLDLTSFSEGPKGTTSSEKRDKKVPYSDRYRDSGTSDIPLECNSPYSTADDFLSEHLYHISVGPLADLHKTFFT